MRTYIYEIYCKSTDTYYIGKTSTSLAQRFYQHKTYKKGILYKEIKKYGEENFERTVLFEIKENVNYVETYVTLLYFLSNLKLYNERFGNTLRSVIERDCQDMNIEEIMQFLSTRRHCSPKEKVYTLYFINNNFLSIKTVPYKKVLFDFNYPDSIIKLYSTNDKTIALKLKEAYMQKLNNLKNIRCGNKVAEETKQKIFENSHKKKVQCVETSQIFSSIRAAAKAANTQHGHILECINGKVKHAGRLDGIKCSWKLVGDNE